MNGAAGIAGGGGYGSPSATGGSTSGNGSYLTPISALPYGQMSNGTGLGSTGTAGSGTAENTGGGTAGSGALGTTAGNGLIMPSMTVVWHLQLLAKQVPPALAILVLVLTEQPAEQVLVLVQQA